MTRLATGSIDVIVSWRKRTPGFTNSLYGSRTASSVVRPNITSSFEKPNTKAVALVDQRHVDAVAERLGEHGAEFEPAEAGAENEDALFHGTAQLDGHSLIPLRG